MGGSEGWSSLRGQKWPSGDIVRTQRQLCRSCDFPAQGCGRSTLPWVTAPTNLATLQELRLAVGVMLNLMVPTNPFLPIILLRVTPTAKRNTYSVATPYYIYIPRVEALHASTLGYENATPTELPLGWAIPTRTPIPIIPMSILTIPTDAANHPNAHPYHPHDLPLVYCGFHIISTGGGKFSRQLFLYRRQPDFFYGRRPLFVCGVF